jgi:1-acyl-sn-glycerol-3-phosphate acyltransferase
MTLRKNYLVGALRLVVLLTWIVMMPIFFMLCRLLRIPGHSQIVPFFHAGTCRILGIGITKSGAMNEQRPTLYVSNHISYIDIFILGCLPAYFIAKSEVAGWPVFGKLAEFQNTLFIERKAGRAKQHLAILKNHFSQGNSLTLFPEGTSTDGVHVEPFKSTLFEAANLADEGALRVAIQPITVAYTHYDNQLITSQEIRDHYAWYARMPFLPHFLGLMPLKKVAKRMIFCLMMKGSKC